MPPTVTPEKPTLPTLWLDASVVIKLTKIKRGEALQSVEIERSFMLLRRLPGDAETAGEACGFAALQPPQPNLLVVGGATISEPAAE